MKTLCEPGMAGMIQALHEADQHDDDVTGSSDGRSNPFRPVSEPRSLNTVRTTFENLFSRSYLRPVQTSPTGRPGSVRHIPRAQNRYPPRRLRVPLELHQNRQNTPNDGRRLARRIGTERA